MHRSRSTLLFAFCCALGLLSAARGQDYRAHVQGSVTDTSGAVLPQTVVTLLNINTGVVMTATSNDSGLYRIDYIDPGTYTLTFEHPGFTKFSQQAFAIQA